MDPSTIASFAWSAASTIGGWAGSAVVENIVSTAYSRLGDRNLTAETKAQLQRLKTDLPKITAVMEIAEALKMKCPRAGEWVEQFRKASREAEDVLDELEYKALEDMVKNRDETGGSASASKKTKLCTVDDDIFIKRLKEVVTMLHEAAAGVNDLLQFAALIGVQPFSESSQDVRKILDRKTTNFSEEREVFGREIEKKKIIDWLKQPTQSKLSSFGIIGVGGQGKTTLAQFAYQEMARSNYFDKRIWVCVSMNFSVEDLTRKILGELGESRSDGKELNALQECLKEKILSKKTLLILDDVWDDKDIRGWQQFIAPLRFVQEGSKILFTTRMKCVADLLASVISTNHKSLSLEGLEEQQLRLLFHSYAFNGVNPDNYTDLQEIGDQILQMFRGCPLAAKVIGSLLHSHLDRPYWRRILNEDSIFNLEEAKNVLEVLKLSYHNLPADLQVCFRFCSIFPQDYMFNKNELIKMWMAVGFIQQHQNKRPEDLGEDYFNYLLRRSFFEYYSESWESEIYVMHDLMHELAQKVSNGECCRVEPIVQPVNIPCSVRHISVHESAIESISHLENLCSLVITTSYTKNEGANSDPFVLPNKLIKKSLRLLKISTYRSCQLLEDASCLVHLRYLSVNLMSVHPPSCWLPASINKLYHLQVIELLNVRWNSSYLGIEPSKMTDLVRLRYIKPMEMVKNICGVHKLSSLQKLTYYVGHDSGHHINELGTLNNLRKLIIYNIENVGDPAEAKGSNLSKKEHLMSLDLVWTEESNSDNSELIIDELQPNTNLMELKISCYNGQRSPKWMNDSPPSNLSCLQIMSCPEWKGQLFSCQFPHLKILIIDDCPNLDKLPDMPLSLTEFQVSNVGLTSLPNLYRSSSNNTAAPISQKSSLKVVTIQICHNLKYLKGFLEQCNVDLQAIEELTIENCKKLIRMPIQGFGNLTSLKNLTMRHCPKLKVEDFKGSLLPENLQELTLENCGKVDVPLLETLSSPSRNLFPVQAEGMNQENNFDLRIMRYPNLIRFPNLPLSLTRLHLENVGVSALPEYNTSSDSSAGPSTPSLKSSLRDVIIKDCPRMTSLNGFLQQEYIDFQSIKSIYISCCKNLVQIPVGAFGKYASLTKLIIIDCPMLEAIDSQSNLLPMTLVTITIYNCGKLDKQLLESASRLTALTSLYLSSCSNITHFPCSENAFVSLSSLNISKCDKLVGHSSSEQEHGVNLQESNSVSLKINCLRIDNLSLLFIEPLKRLTSVSTLTIGNCSGIDVFPDQWLLRNSTALKKLEINDASSLKSLPAIMASLTALEGLFIFEAALLDELPELPDSLETLLIWGAESLEGLPGLPPSLTRLVIVDAKSLKSLPATMSRLTALRKLEIRGADLLKKLPELPASLETLLIFGAESLEGLPGLPASLTILVIEDAKSLKSMPATMSRLTALRELEITGADLLKKLPELPPSLYIKSIYNSKGEKLFT
jgi:NB-ARC domain/Rx N-terminal domain